MKQKRNYLLLILVTAFLLIFNISNASVVIDSQLLEDEDINPHRARLHSLFLEKDDDNGYAFASLISYKNHLVISNGLVVGVNNSVNNSLMGSVGGGLGNTIERGNYAGIAGGTANKISMGDNSIIGGGSNNTITGSDAVIAGGDNNEATTGGIIVGGQGNTAEGGIVLGGAGNKSYGGKNLVFGKNAEGGEGSFAWNGKAESFSSYIGAKNGILIGTYDAITGINLVVSGAVKLGGNDSTDGVAGEIKVVGGCFYAYDGEYWHLINQSGTGSCEGFEAAKPCLFGDIQLQAGDRTSAYDAVISPECKAAEIVCKNGELVKYGGSEADEDYRSYKYSYCYPGEGEVKPEVAGGVVFEEITICNPSNSSECITIMDRNLCATTNDITNADSYGCYYQWGNNYGFPSMGSVKTSSSQVNAGGYGPGNYYESDTFIIRTGSPYSWDSTNNHNLWGGIGDTLSSNGAGSNEDRQGPCPSGYHVPSILEWKNLYNWRCSSNTSSCSSSNKGTLFGQYFKIPFAGNRDHVNTNHVQLGSAGGYWSSSIDLSYEDHNSRNMYFTSSSVVPQNNARRSRGMSVRCFKNQTQMLNCGGGAPSGNGYRLGGSKYADGYTPTSWTYTSNPTLGSCQYTCNTANGYAWNGSTCGCAADYYRVGDGCVACPSGSHTSNGNTSTSCTTCESYQTWNGSACVTPRSIDVEWIGGDGYSKDGWNDDPQVRYVGAGAGSATAKVTVRGCSNRYHDTSWPSYSAYPSWISVSPLSDSYYYGDLLETEITISWDANTSQYPRGYVGDEHDSRIVFRGCGDYQLADKLYIQQASSYGCPGSCYSDWWNCKDAHPGSSNYSSHNYVCEKVEGCGYCTYSE